MSQFIHSDLGVRSRGDVVEVTLGGNQANVRLMEPHNFNSYKAGKAYRFFGGLVRSSPVRVIIPRDGHGHIVVDMQSLGGGRTRAQIRVVSSSARPAIATA